MPSKTRESTSGNTLSFPRVCLTRNLKGQIATLTRQATYVFNPLEETANGQVIAVEFKLLMFEIIYALFTAE